MTRFLARRLLLQVLVFAGVLVLTFLISHSVPGDPALLRAGPRASPEIIAQLRHDMGLDRPLPVQLWLYLRELVRGDLGLSVRTQRPVLQDIAEHFPATFELTTAALLVVVLVGIPLGVLSAVQKDRFPDHLSRIIAISGVSLPVFWLGLMLIYIFFVRLGWLPGTGRLDMGVEPPSLTGLYVLDALLIRDWALLGSALRHLFLPVLLLSYVSLAPVVRMVRSSMLEILGQDYIRTARAKGLAERVVIYRHALRNALIPTLTIVGLAYGTLLQGAVVTETIFAWPGMAYYAVGSMTYLDYPAVMGITLVSALIYSTVNLLVDLLYGVVDPRIRYD
ncbi:MAG: ABC transporter permease [Armatimonadota bacterium]|nr:ABC transporter permease [Armatimonadota bacterium]MDR7467736.1 ABC transporter permease [Armatimonadota bacterium]MDR7494936.1 ABC transporter permease [Armatimonadota bacterium]MDR7499799.1 ABC transporter permease [Armatimonadota bacterium]MDR7505255.1 ABC transporter permease [Armatimonadota bacterium]